MSIIVDAATDSQALKLPNGVESGNRSEESQAAVDGLVSLVGGPEMLQTRYGGASTSLRNPEDESECQMSFSTFSQSHQPLRSPQRTPASPHKSSHGRKPSESTGPASSADQIAKELVVAPAAPQNGTFRHLNQVLDATQAPPTSSASSDARVESQWADARPDEFVHTQGPLGDLQSRPKGNTRLQIPLQSAEHLPATITEGPSTSTPRKGVAPLPSPAPTPVVKTSISSPARSGPAYDSDASTPPPPIRAESQFTRAPLRPANPCSPVRNIEGSPHRTSYQSTAYVRPASASRALPRNPGTLHMEAVPLDRNASRQRIQEAKPKKRKSNDFDFPESSEDSCKISPEARPYKRASTSKWGAEERSASDKENSLVGGSRGEMSVSRAETSGKELDLTADTTRRSPVISAGAKDAMARLAPPNVHLAIPSSSSGGTYLGTQDMSLQIGEASCSALFDMATGGPRSGLTQTAPGHYIVTSMYQESQEEVDELDSQLNEKAEAMQQDGNTVPSTSEADPPAEVSSTSNMALDPPQDRSVITSPIAANIADPTPPTEAVTDDEEILSGATSRSSARYRSQIAAPVSDSRSLGRGSAVSAANSTYMSNGRGVDPPAGRSLQRSRPTSMAYVADNLPEEDNQTQRADQGRSQTQKVPTSDAVVEQDQQAMEGAGLEQVPSSPSALAEKTRLIPDSQHPGRGVEEADRTYATSEADGLMEELDPAAVALNPATLAGSVLPEQEQAESSTSHVSESTINASSKARKGKQRAADQSGENAEGSGEVSNSEPARKSASKRKTKSASEHVNKRMKGQRQVEEPAAGRSSCEQGSSASASMGKSTSKEASFPDNDAAERDNSRDVVEVSASRSTRNTSTAAAAVSSKNKGKERATNDKSVTAGSTPNGTGNKRTVLKDRTNLAKAGAGPASKTGRKASTSAVIAREASQSNPGGGAASRARRVIQNDSLATSQVQDVPMAVDNDGQSSARDEEENEEEGEETRPVASTSAAAPAIDNLESPLPVDRIYVKLDKFCYPGRLTLADNGNTPFRVQMDDTTYADLHVHQLSSKLVKCKLYEGDLVVRATNANGVKKDKAKDKREVVRLLKAGTPENARGKTIPFGTTLMPEDIVVVKAVAGKGQDSSDVMEERWLVEVTVLLPISANAVNERKLSSDELDELEGYLAESQGSATASASTSRTSSSFAKPGKTATSRKSTTPKPASASAPAAARAKQSKVFSSFGLVFTAGAHANIVDPAKEKARAAGATLVGDVSELFTTDDINAESQTDTRLTFDADSQQAGLDTILLIAYRPLTTPKYLKALALGVPCVSVEWVNACIVAEECFPWKPFALGSGHCEISKCHILGLQAYVISNDSFSLASIAARQHELHIFSGRKVVFLSGSTDASNQRADMARDWLTCLGAEKVLTSKASSPPVSKELEKYDLIISDNQAAAAKKLGSRYTVESWEWLKSCVIAGRIV